MGPTSETLMTSHKRTKLTLSSVLTGLPVLASGLAILSSLACTPYERRTGEYSAGAVDPLKFAAPYLGRGGTGKMPGMGVFAFAKAYANGKDVLYYPLAFNGRQARTADAMGKPLDQLDLNYLKPPLGYVFDPTATETAPDSAKCQKPEGYVFDQQRDAVRYDRQGNIFTALPIDSTTPGSTTYVPIINEVAVTSNGNPCQDIKSEATLVKRSDVSLDLIPPPEGVVDALPTGKPGILFRAFAIIDPAAEVTTPKPMGGGNGAPEECGPETDAICKQFHMLGIGPQRWGWFKQYLLAYLDGGNIPLQVINPPGKQRVATQNLYVPTSALFWNPETKQFEEKGVPGPGVGPDVFEYRRGEAGYSPICRIWTFDPVDVNDPTKLEKKASDVQSPKDTGKYTYCLQAPPS